MRSYIYYVGIHKLGNSRARQNKGNVDPLYCPSDLLRHLTYDSCRSDIGISSCPSDSVAYLVMPIAQ